MSNKQLWIDAVLSNDEISTDDELIDYFMVEGGLSRAEAAEHIKNRSSYLYGVL